MAPTPRRAQVNASLFMVVGLGLFIVVAFSSYKTLRAVEQTTNQRAQARQSLLISKVVLSQLKDVETGQRGYILTGNPLYLEAYESGTSQVGAAYASLQRQLDRIPGAQPPVQGLDRLIDDRLALARRNIEVRRREGFDAAQRLVASDEGRLIMDAIRARFDRLDRILREEIKRRDQQVMRLMQRARWAEGTLTLLGILLMVLGYLMLLREQKRRGRAEHALRHANVHLEDAVAQRTAELEQARREIGAFALELDRSIEAERRRLAREVHDQLGQIFTALRMQLSHTYAGAPGMDEPLHRMNAMLDEGIATARRIARELRPPLLDDLGLGPALTHRAERFREETGIACEAAVADGDHLQPEQATQLYRIAQEALTNVARHAAAGHVRIEGQATGGEFLLSVEDDGQGMSHDATTSLGLLSMRERAALAGGCLELTRGAAGGVHVLVRLPLNPHTEEIDAHPDH